MQPVRKEIEVNDFVKEFRKLQQQLWKGLPSYWIGGLEQPLISARELVRNYSGYWLYGALELLARVMLLPPRCNVPILIGFIIVED